MKKVDFIARYGEEAWQKVLEQQRVYREEHKEQVNAYNRKYREEHREELIAADKRRYEEHRDERKVTDRKYREEHPKEVNASNREISCKGGKYYDKHLIYEHTGLRGERNKIRMKHADKYRQYKMIIAPDSQLHHEWIPATAEYRGVALVEADQHMHGFVYVIEILDGKITLLTEEEVKEGKKKRKENDI